MAKSTFESAGLSQVKPQDRKSWLSIAFIWSGFVCCVPALMVGAGITMGLSFGQAALSMCIGYAICVLLMSLMSCLSSDLGIPTVVAASGAFGKTGSSYMVSLVIAICNISWFGFQAVVCGESFAAILNTFGIPLPGVVSTILWGLIMCITAVVGINLIKILNVISVPALVLILVYAMIVVFQDPESSVKIANYAPATQSTLMASIGTAVGGFVAGSVLAIHCGVVGMDTQSIVTMLASIGSPILGLLILVLATWTTNVTNAYSAGFGLLNLTRAKDNKQAVCTLTAGVLGTLLAVLGITNYFNDFLNILAAFIPPVAGVVIMDYFVIHKARPSEWRSIEGINWNGPISCIAGGVVALAFPGVLVPTLNGIVVLLCAVPHPLPCAEQEKGPGSRCAHSACGGNGGGMTVSRIRI